MKKRVVYIVLLGLLLIGCTNNKKETKKEVVEDTKETISDTHTSKDEQQETAPVESEPVSLSQDDYIIQTLDQYGYHAPDRNAWIVKQEGNNKIAVTIKENIGKGRPNITKLIFLWNNSSNDAQVLFVMVNNQVMFETE